MEETDSLGWLSEWYGRSCNGDWEHDFGVAIETLDNPGWAISIDTEGTSTVLSDRPWELVENSDDDWYGSKVLNGKFEASGDPTKLSKLIFIFKNAIEECPKLC